MPLLELNTATVSAKSAISAVLPAAGVGLVLNDGVSVSQIREEIKKRKEEKEPAEPVASNDTKASVTQTVAESATGAEGFAVEAESTAETEIIEAVEPGIKEPETKISDEEREKEQDVLIIAQVNDYVNIPLTPPARMAKSSVSCITILSARWLQRTATGIR